MVAIFRLLFGAIIAGIWAEVLEALLYLAILAYYLHH